MKPRSRRRKTASAAADSIDMPAKDGFMPPPGRPPMQRWEWTPESVTQELYPFYDYILVRGSGFTPERGEFHVKFRGEHWVVYERDGR